MIIHPTEDVVITGDAHGRIEQWIVLSHCAPPAWAIEEVNRANMQHTPLPPMFDESQPHQELRLTTPVDVGVMYDVESGGYSALARSPRSSLSFFFKWSAVLRR